MIRKRTLTLVVLAVTVALAGCSAGTTDGNTSGDGSTDGAAWCNTGESTQWTNPETGERVSLTINGTTTHEGKDVCVGSWATSNPDGDVARVQYMYTEDGSYTRWVSYDANGNVVNEFETSGQPTTGQSPNGQPTDGIDSQSWCPTGQSFQSSSPQTGEQVSFVYEGITTEDGTEVCKAVYETNNPDGDIARSEYYFNEAGTYTKWVTYDENGVVIDETVVDQTTP
jgi:hypothetical protein